MYATHACQYLIKSLSPTKINSSAKDKCDTDRGLMDEAPPSAVGRRDAQGVGQPQPVPAAPAAPAAPSAARLGAAAAAGGVTGGDQVASAPRAFHQAAVVNESRPLGGAGPVHRAAGLVGRGAGVRVPLAQLLPPQVHRREGILGVGAAAVVRGAAIFTRRRQPRRGRDGGPAEAAVFALRGSQRRGGYRPCRLAVAAGGI